MDMQTTIRDDTTARHLRKYADRNPFQRIALGRFYDAVAAEIRALEPRSVLDFGCGEGFLLDKMAARQTPLAGYVGLDLREDAVAAASARHPSRDFRQLNLFDWPLAERFELVAALEVLEHLPEPERHLERLAALSDRHLLITVPHEPWFRLANLARGRDIRALGNHPEHVNHWHPASLARLVAAFADVLRVRSVLPFVILVARVR